MLSLGGDSSSLAAQLGVSTVSVMKGRGKGAKGAGMKGRGKAVGGRGAGAQSKRGDSSPLALGK